MDANINDDDIDNFKQYIEDYYFFIAIGDNKIRKRFMIH